GDRAAAQPREPRHHRRIVGERAIPVELEDIVEDALDVIEEVRPVGMAAQLDFLPDRELPVDLALEMLDPLLEAAQLPLEAGVAHAVDLELADPVFQLHERLFEFEMCHVDVY